MTSNTIHTATLEGFAFPVAKVRYTGNGYSATLYRDRDRTYRARVSYDHKIGPGARNAVRAAVAVFDKCLADNEPGLTAEGDYVTVPGDLNADFYVFTFVPKHFFA